MVTVDYSKKIGVVQMQDDEGEMFEISIYGGGNVLFALIYEHQKDTENYRSLGVFYVDEDHLCRVWYRTHDILGYEGHPHLKVISVSLNTWFKVYEDIALYLTEQGIPVSLYREKCTRVSDNMIPLT